MPPLRFSLIALISTVFICSAISDDSLGPSYNEYCSSIVPESTPTKSTYKDPASLPSLTTSYFTGGEQILRLGNNRTFYYDGKSLRLRIRPDCHQTEAPGVYKIDGTFYVRSPYVAYVYSGRQGNYASRESYYRRRRSRGGVGFVLTGFWSDNLRKACMVGRASLKLGDGKTLNLAGVLKLKFAGENPTLNTSIISGTFGSTIPKGDPGYFDPISMFNFPDFPRYNYTVHLEDTESLAGLMGSKDQSLSLEPHQFCNVLSWRVIIFNMKYAAECNTDPSGCSPLGSNGTLPSFMHLRPIQCSAVNQNMRIRYLVTFGNGSYINLDDKSSYKSMLIAEGLWDDKNGQTLVQACPLLDPMDHFEDAVGDCDIRLSLRYPSVWTIRDNSWVVGQIWTAKNEELLRKINLTSDVMGDVVAIPGLRYEYTEIKNAQKSCSGKKAKKGMIYPDGKSMDLRFDASVVNSKDKQIANSYAMPFFVGNEVSSMVINRLGAFNAMAPAPAADAGFATLSEAEAHGRVSVFNISYKINIMPYFDSNSSKWFPVIGESQTGVHPGVQIVAEGVYNAKTGQLCMVGCRKLGNTSTTDCTILLKFEFAPLNARSRQYIKGSIKSTRPKGDPLHFEVLTLSSAAYYIEAAEASVWRMDLEVTLVLVSNTLFCIFVWLQIFHVKRHPETVASISLIMVLILALGHMIPLVLNVEAIFLDNHSKQTVSLSSGGWVEANEVAVRVITMVAFLLQIRLLQLVWAAKQDPDREKSFHGEGKASLIMLPLYILGAVFTILLNWTRNRFGYQNYSLWGDLRSYAGLMLDGFLLPQIVLNTARGSTEKSLSHAFYVGTSAVRMVPHAYNQYRSWNYPAPPLYGNGTYYYANPAGDFYSTAWDVMIPLGAVVMAAVVFVQQRRGGRWMLPQRFRELELYAKVPTVDNQ